MRQRLFLTLLSVLFCGGTAFSLFGCGNAAKRSLAFKGYCDTVLNDSLRLIVRGHFVENDTVFFLKEYLKDREGMPCNALIYLDANPDSRYRTTDYWVNRFDISDDLERWSRTWKEQHVPVGKFDLQGLPAEWIPLHYRNGKPYVLATDRADNPPQARLAEGVVGYKQESGFRFVPAVCYKMSFTDYRLGNLFLHFIDRHCRVAVWETVERGFFYDLMIPVESACYFDVVDEAEARTFRPDAVDIKALLEALKAGKRIDLYNLDREYAVPSSE